MLVDAGVVNILALMSGLCLRRRSLPNGVDLRDGGCRNLPGLALNHGLIHLEGLHDGSQRRPFSTGELLWHTRHVGEAHPVAGRSGRVGTIERVQFPWSLSIAEVDGPGQMCAVLLGVGRNRCCP